MGMSFNFAAVYRPPTAPLSRSATTRHSEQTVTHERYLREWLRAQAAGGYITYEAKDDTYSLSPKHSFALAQPDSPAGMFKIEKQLVEAFRSVAGFAWSQHDTDMFDGVGTDRGSRFQSFSTRGGDRLQRRLRIAPIGR